jgi:hypothetical protein
MSTVVAATLNVSIGFNASNLIESSPKSDRLRRQIFCIAFWRRPPAITLQMLGLFSLPSPFQIQPRWWHQSSEQSHPDQADGKRRVGRPAAYRSHRLANDDCRARVRRLQGRAGLHSTAPRTDQRRPTHRNHVENGLLAVCRHGGRAVDKAVDGAVNCLG